MESAYIDPFFNSAMGFDSSGIFSSSLNSSQSLPTPITSPQPTHQKNLSNTKAEVIHATKTDLVANYEKDVQPLLKRLNKDNASQIVPQIAEKTKEMTSAAKKSGDAVEEYTANRAGLETGEKVFGILSNAKSLFVAPEYTSVLENIGADTFELGMLGGKYKVFSQRIQELTAKKGELEKKIASCKPEEENALREEKEKVEKELVKLGKEVDDLKEKIAVGIPKLLTTSAKGVLGLVKSEDLFNASKEALEQIGGVCADLSIVGSVFTLAWSIKTTTEAQKTLRETNEQLQKLTAKINGLDDKDPFKEILQAKVARMQQKLTEQKVDIAKAVLKTGTSTVAVALGTTKAILAITGTTLAGAGAAALSATGIGLAVVGGVLGVTGIGVGVYAKRNDIKHGALAAQDAFQSKVVEKVQQKLTERGLKKTLSEIELFEQKQKEHQAKVQLLGKMEQGGLERYRRSSSPTTMQRQQEMWKRQSQEVEKEGRSIYDSLEEKRPQYHRSQSFLKTMGDKMKVRQKRVADSKAELEVLKLINQLKTFDKVQVLKLKTTLSRNITDGKFCQDIASLMQEMGEPCDPKVLTVAKTLEFIAK